MRLPLVQTRTDRAPCSGLVRCAAPAKPLPLDARVLRFLPSDVTKSDLSGRMACVDLYHAPGEQRESWAFVVVLVCLARHRSRTRRHGCHDGR